MLAPNLAIAHPFEAVSRRSDGARAIDDAKIELRRHRQALRSSAKTSENLHIALDDAPVDTRVTDALRDAEAAYFQCLDDVERHLECCENA